MKKAIFATYLAILFNGLFSFVAIASNLELPNPVAELQCKIQLISAPKSSQEASKQLDRLFLESTKIFPTAVANELRAVYLGKSVRTKLIGDHEAHFGALKYEVHGNSLDFDPNWKIELNAKVLKTPLFLRVLLFHELLVHAGQFLTKSQLTAHYKKMKLQQFTRLSEIHAFAIEAVLYKFIGRDLLVQEVQNSPFNDEVKQELLVDFDLIFGSEKHPTPKTVKEYATYYVRRYIFQDIQIRKQNPNTRNLHVITTAEAAQISGSNSSIFWENFNKELTEIIK